MERGLAGSLRRFLEVVSGLGVEQVGGRHVGQRLRRDHRCRRELPGRLAVQVERAELGVSMLQREREHGSQASGQRPRRESREPVLSSEVRHRHGFAGPVGQHARPLAQLGLQLLEAHR
jgi:hypothetical protein